MKIVENCLPIFCSVADFLELWGTFRQGLSEDIIYRHPSQCSDDCFSAALIRIENILRMHGRFLRDFGLSEPNRDVNFSDSQPRPNPNFVRIEVRNGEIL